MNTPAFTLAGNVASVWSCRDVGAPELRAHAAPVITHETRRGVALLGLVALLLLRVAAATTGGNAIRGSMESGTA